MNKRVAGWRRVAVTAERIRDKLAASKRKGLWMGGYVPMGYQPNGRTLVIDGEEAAVIRTLYDLYEQHRSIISVRRAAANLKLRSRLRPRSDGTTTGGRPFDRGQIHHILTNPIYAGRIRHKDKVFDGQHPPLIEPDRWDAIQRLLFGAAGRTRGQKTAAHPSPLAGKLFDETGDRLTPSHSRKNGKRLRYYISRRLVEDRSRNHPDAWRLPAPQLENAVVTAIRTKFAAAEAALKLIRQVQAGETEALSQSIKRFASELGGADLPDLVSRIDIRPGAMRITLDGHYLADRLSVTSDRVQADALQIDVPFRLRRRGVETKIVVGDAPAEIDRTLIGNIVRARKWYADLVAGKTFAEISEREGTSKRRVQDIVDLAFLSPELLKQIVAGTQPAGLTTDSLVKNGLPVIWADQHAAFAETD